MKEEKTYCVYMHTSKINGKRYVGITGKENPEDRWVNGFGYHKLPRFYNYIRKYGWDSLEHEVLFKNLSKIDAENKEIELIKLYDSTNKKLGFNISNGGDSYGKHSLESKVKMSKILVDNKSHSGINNGFYGKKLSEEHKLKMLEASRKSGNKPKAVIQYDLDMNFIKEFNSVCKTKLDGHSTSCVTRCCKNESAQHHGYIWKYKKDIENANN